jgi:hypothetical protein
VNGALRRRLLGAALGVAVLGTALATTASPASAAAISCYAGYQTAIGGETQYFTCYSGNRPTRVYGWVRDTKSDGKCVWVRVTWYRAYDSPTNDSGHACPNGTTLQFDFSMSGADSAGKTLIIG